MTKIWTPEHERGTTLLLPRIRKYRSLQRRLPATKVGVGNWLRLEVFDCIDGSSRWLTPWFHNHIPDAGLDLLALSTNRYTCCQVGQGTDAPTDEDTALQNYSAGTNTRTQEGTSGEVVTPPFWRESYYRYSFAQGALNGNYSEVGVGTAVSGGSLFSRELIRDALGEPTTVSVASHQQLRVHYRVRHYAPVADVVGTRFIDPTMHDYIRRAANAGSANWAPGNSSGSSATIGSTSSGSWSAWSSNIAAATSAPTSGLISNFAPSVSVDAYTPGTFVRNLTAELSTAQGNGNIRTIAVLAATAVADLARVQMQFDPFIPKTDQYTLEFEFTWQWERYSE